MPDQDPEATACHRTSVNFTHLPVNPAAEMMRHPFAGSEHTITLSAETPVVSTVHHPLGSPSGPGLFRMKGAQLPAYVQNVARALLRTGRAKDESAAIQIAIGVIRRWAAGGGKVTPEVRAAAGKAITEWEALKTAAHSHASDSGRRVVALAGPEGYIHGWIKVGEGTGDLKVRERGKRQNMSVGGGLAVAGGSSDLSRPLADALTRASQTGNDHYIIPTAMGMAATARKSDATSMSGYIHVRPDGTVTKMSRDDWEQPHTARAVLSDRTVAAVLDGELSKTKTASPPAPRKPAADPDASVPASVIARAVKDMQRNKALQTAEYKARIKDVATKSGHLNLIPPGWANDGPAVDLAGMFTEANARAGYANPGIAGQIALAAWQQEIRGPHGQWVVSHYTGQDLSKGRYNPESHFHYLGLRPAGADKDAGHITWGDEKHPDIPGTVHSVYVDEGKRGQGIATQLFRRARQITPGLKHSDDPSGAARKWIRGMETGHGTADWGISLAGMFTESLHPRTGGKFASKGGPPVASARARNTPATPPVRVPGAGAGQMTRAQQLHYQAAQDRHLAHEIMIKVAGLVRARDAAIAGIGQHPKAAVSGVKSAAAAKAAATRKASPKSAQSKAAAKAAGKAAGAGKAATPGPGKIARLNGQIRLLTKDARMLAKAANRLDKQAAGM